jgi:hypothetical protein
VEETLAALRLKPRTYAEAVDECKLHGYVRYADQPAMIISMQAAGLKPVFYYRKETPASEWFPAKVEGGFVCEKK